MTQLSLRLALALVLPVMLACGRSNDDDPAATSACERLRAHLAEVSLTDAKGISSAELAAHRSAMEAALGSAFVTSCSSTLTAEQVECAMRATDATAVASCTESTKE